MASIYISGALTSADSLTRYAEQREFYESIARVCACQGLTAYLPHLKTDPIKHPEYTPKQVYEINRGEVTKARLVIAYVGMPSLGVGSELEIANQQKIPVVLLYEEGAKVSRHILGLPVIFKIINFSGHKDCTKKLSSFLKNVEGMLNMGDTHNGS